MPFAEAETKLVKQNVIIFGAGNAGIAAKSNLNDQYQLIAFCDNNHAQMLDLDGVPVISPQELESLNYDKILVASEFSEQIENQLLNQLKIDKSKVEVLSARNIKQVQFGKNTKTSKAGLDILFTISEFFRINRILHYVDAGTLLGLYRDGALIPWDDDLDFAIGKLEVQAILENMNGLLEKLELQTSTPWEYSKHYSDKAFGAVAQGDLRSIKLFSANTSAGLPMIDLFVKYIDGAWMYYTLASRGIKMPSKHLLETQLYDIAGKSVLIPGQVENYLESHYGMNWRVPNKNWNLSDIASATVF